MADTFNGAVRSLHPLPAGMGDMEAVKEARG